MSGYVLGMDFSALTRPATELIDGAVVSALVGDGEGPREIARATLVDVIDVLAPIDERSLRV